MRRRHNPSATGAVLEESFLNGVHFRVPAVLDGHDILCKGSEGSVNIVARLRRNLEPSDEVIISAEEVQSTAVYSAVSEVALVCHENNRQEVACAESDIAVELGLTACNSSESFVASRWIEDHDCTISTLTDRAFIVPIVTQVCNFFTCRLVFTDLQNDWPTLLQSHKFDSVVKSKAVRALGSFREIIIDIPSNKGRFAAA